MQGSTFGDTPARIPVDVRRFADMKPLSNAYAYDFASVAPFFAGDPSASDSWAATIADSGPGRIAPDRNRHRGPAIARQAPARAIEASGADRLAQCGHPDRSAGTVRRPAYTPLKALSTLAGRTSLARVQRGGRADFRVDAEDHDWDEVRRAWSSTPS